jgi:pimeloyl-ACP methyl ester carboxylesterase
VTTHAVTLDGVGSIDVTVAVRGEGRPAFLLHGGAGPQSVAGLAALLTDRLGLKVYTPTHPGFGGTARPEGLDSVRKLAEVYTRLLAALGLDKVLVIGNSIGGWIAAEMALVGGPRVGQLVLIDAGGIEVAGIPTLDVFSLSPAELSKLSFHDPTKFPINPAAMSDEQRAGMAANRAALAVYAGRPSMVDLTLRGRLKEIKVPTLVVWGESDRVVVPEYGRAYAAAIPGAQFHLIPGAGHLPQIESPEKLLTAIGSFVGDQPAGHTGATV